MSLSVAVMAHPDRAGWARRLAADLGDVPIVWDRGAGIWDTGRRALLAYDPDASHHLVVQDDAVICRDLLAGLEAALPHVGPRSPVGLYIRAGGLEDGTRRATESGASWMVGVGAPLWGVASAHPTATIPDLVAAGDEMDNRSRYDLQTGSFYRRATIPVWYTWPSLVDHRHEAASLLGNRDGRHAQRFIGADASALSVDWSTPPHHITH